MSTSSLYTATPNEAMLASFPTRIQQLTGDPTLCGLITIFRHHIVCAQSQYTDYCVLNLLYLVVPLELWTRYHTNTVHPNAPAYPGNVPAYLPHVSPVENTAIHETYLAEDNAGLAGGREHEQGTHRTFIVPPTTGIP